MYAQYNEACIVLCLIKGQDIMNYILIRHNVAKSSVTQFT